MDQFIFYRVPDSAIILPGKKWSDCERIYRMAALTMIQEELVVINDEVEVEEED